MSITLAGVLSIKSINGSRGAFSVGELEAEEGTFRIKDALLDEFEPGRYRGRFIISRIFPQAYTWRGTVRTEVRASLIEILLDEPDEEVSGESRVDTRQEHAVAAPVPTEVEPGPIDEQMSVAAVPTPAEQPANVQSAESNQAAVRLFSEELQADIDAGGPIKLDPTIDRALFRQQRDGLKAIGFRFDASAQHWIKA